MFRVWNSLALSSLAENVGGKTFRGPSDCTSLMCGFWRQILLGVLETTLKVNWDQVANARERTQLTDDPVTLESFSLVFNIPVLMFSVSPQVPSQINICFTETCQKMAQKQE